MRLLMWTFLMLPVRCYVGYVVLSRAPSTTPAQRMTYFQGGMREE